MPEPSSSSASVRFLDRERVLAELRRSTARARACPGVIAIHLFGSFAHGVPTPRSDVDILVVIADNADRHQARECCLEAFRSLPVPVDLFVWTEHEVAESLARGQGLAATALRHAVRLA
ncbi:nucleotidyltransferase domain-containing protein [Thermomicrobium sp. CFH 73360]|uniref:nucleotidyltransferase domain-containing protein n=1 Tax=Thermomicrobium sp. CFH 73360 TaxID=2951987 RepID=UPI002077372F|nr:nucleotidyltransferase domain-containing protein [Thermomicrobium sp. CFH 73360]MCM8746212.1 nucleotidyltransferase domain-containing protein [Thermomicrobium sp. CFH 73360]